MAASIATPFTYLNVTSPEGLTTRSERLAYDCGKVMERIGKIAMWNDWLDEEDLYAEGAEREKFWENKCKEAWAAEATFNLTPEQRAEHQEKIRQLRGKWVKLTYEAKCASTMYWDQTGEGEEFCADAAYYWQKEIERLEWKIAQVKMEVARRRAAVEAAAAQAAEAAAGGGAAPAAAVADPSAEFARYATAELRGEVADVEDELQQMARFAQARQMTPAEVKEMGARTDWVERARAELARRQAAAT